ncbi:hypothetical protein WMY93_025818 [Mugilogobius chulae]|uniref:Fibronectin type-III domain-containing protein n=1 Tax=Mugilogobius chulae TaxID=88201 RepID=A0AAW0N833_9GOBI
MSKVSVHLGLVVVRSAVKALKPHPHTDPRSDITAAPFMRTHTDPRSDITAAPFMHTHTHTHTHASHCFTKGFFVHFFELWTMAVRSCIFLLTKLSLFIHTVKACAVNCLTDYKSLLNCSCSDLEPAHTLHLQVFCRHADLSLNESCELSRQQPFCVMYPDIMDEIADMETMCYTTVFSEQDRRHADISNASASWLLRHTIKPWPPFNIHVEEIKGFYNISWDMENLSLCLNFRVNIKSTVMKSFLLQESSEHTSLLVEHTRLLPGRLYEVSVQARLCPGDLYEGPWSDWNSTSFRTPGQAAGLLEERCSGGEMNAYNRLTERTARGSSSTSEIYGTNVCSKAWVTPVFAEQNPVNKDTMMEVKLEPAGLSHSLCSVSVSTVSTEHLLSQCLVTSEELRELLCDQAVLHTQPQNTHLYLSSLNFLQELGDEMLSGSDYPVIDLDTIDSGFEECSSPPVTGPSAEQLCGLHNSNYVKQYEPS